MRIGTDRLREKRAAHSSRILLTGGAGFLGSHIAAALLRSGFKVIEVVRPVKGLSAGARVARLMDWFGLEEEFRRNLEVVEDDISRPGFGAEESGRLPALNGIDEIVHCASNTSFAERKRAEVEAANVDGLRNVLDLAVRGGCAFFHHVSTAYVAGRRTGPCPEDWVEEGPFTNVYEETKAHGEIMARDVCARQGLRLNVYRPTIVYGDSRTGRTLRFNALYFPVKAAVYLRDIYLADIREKGGRKAAELGIRLTEGGGMVMPIRLEVARQGGINLVPIDHCVRAFMAIFEDGLDGGIHHIANPRATRIENVVDFGKRRFRLEGIETCGAADFTGRPKNALEILYDSYLEVFRPYMQDTRSFIIANAAPMLEKRGLACPVFDYEMFARCMDFAVQVDWGTRLFAR
ncbi:MAG: SDR family oxidoreductase [Candidatus Aminicenantales bacterium]